MSGRYLLDTNTIIALFADDHAVTDRLKSAEEVFTASIVIGELFFGAHGSGRRTDNLAQVDDFAASSRVLNCDVETARWYGEIKQRLRQKGRPIPENDIWIAAIALQHDLTVITRDLHFKEVESLGIEAW